MIILFWLFFDRILAVWLKFDYYKYLIIYLLLILSLHFLPCFCKLIFSKIVNFKFKLLLSLCRTLNTEEHAEYLALNTALQFSSMKVFATNKHPYQWCKKGIVVVDIIAPLL